LATQRVRLFAGQSLLSPGTGLLWLEDLLRVPADVQAAPGAAGERRQVPLQTVVTDWNPSLQPRILAMRMRQLRQLAPALPPESRALALSYAAVLQSYLGERNQSRAQPSLRGLAGYAAGQAVRNAVARLDALDARCQELRARLSATGPGPVPGPLP